MKVLEIKFDRIGRYIYIGTTNLLNIHIKSAGQYSKLPSFIPVTIKEIAFYNILNYTFFWMPRKVIKHTIYYIEAPLRSIEDVEISQ